MARIFPRQTETAVAGPATVNTKKSWTASAAHLATRVFGRDVAARLVALYAGVALAATVVYVLVDTRNALFASRAALERHSDDRLAVQAVNAYLRIPDLPHVIPALFGDLLFRLAYGLGTTPLAALFMFLLRKYPEYVCTSLESGLVLASTMHDYDRLTEDGGSFITVKPPRLAESGTYAFIAVVAIQCVALYVAALIYYRVVYPLRLALSRWSFGERAIRLAGLDPVPLDHSHGNYIRSRGNNAEMLRCAEAILRAQDTMERIRGEHDGSDSKSNDSDD